MTNVRQSASDAHTGELWASATTRAGRTNIMVLVAILAGAALLYFCAYDPGKFGSSHDDGIYVASARALATGNGYRLISLPYEPAATKHPPFYPFLLSLIWRVDSRFPSNVNAMVALSIIATLAFLVLTWRYLSNQHYATSLQALLIVGITAVNWRTTILATGVFSEMIYAALSVASLHLAERFEVRRREAAPAVLVGALAGLAFLTRSSGVALLMGIAAYFVIRRKVRFGLIVATVGAVFVIGWVWWSNANRTTVSGVNVAYYTDYLGHLRQVVMDLREFDHSSTAGTIFRILGVNALMLVVISIPVVCMGLDYNWVGFPLLLFIFIAVGYVRSVSRRWRLLHLYIVFYLVLHLFWLPYVSYDRFLIPILPFLLRWLVLECNTLLALARKNLSWASPIMRKAGAGALIFALLVTISIAGYNYAIRVYSLVQSASFIKDVKPNAHDREAIEWIRGNTDPSDVVACDRDPIYYLYSGRKTTHSLPMSPGIDWQHDPAPIFDILKQGKVKYLVLTSIDFEFKSLKDLIDAHPDRFNPMFKSADGQTLVYRVGAATPMISTRDAREEWRDAEYRRPATRYARP
jgi:Dolichyl-phosphate-mannose-protein mannosyltransferase